MKSKKYSFLNHNKIFLQNYSLVPLRKCDIQKIRKWRNEQINVLRQKIPLTKEAQTRYYYATIKKSFYKTNPAVILFSFLHNNDCIGYGGLVSINWKTKQAELSFILDTERVKKIRIYQKEFRIFLRLILRLNVEQIKFKSIFTETYNIRPVHLKILESSGFKRIKMIKNSKKLTDDDIVDSIFHEYRNL